MKLIKTDKIKSKYKNIIFLIILLTFLSITLKTIGVIKIKGDSMLPLYKNNDIVFYLKGFKGVNIGDDVIVNVTNLEVPFDYIIKRVDDIKYVGDMKGNRYYKLTSLNNDIETLDSNIIGTVPDIYIVGRVLFKI